MQLNFENPYEMNFECTTEKFHVDAGYQDGRPLDKSLTLEICSVLKFVINTYIQFDYL